MIAALILLLSVAALAQFFLSYVRSLLLASAQQAIAPSVLEACMLESADVQGRDFHGLMLRAQLYSKVDAEGSAVLAVRVYFSLVGLLSLALGPLAPALRRWLAQEQAACSRFALAALNRRVLIDSRPSN